MYGLESNQPRGPQPRNPLEQRARSAESLLTYTSHGSSSAATPSAVVAEGASVAAEAAESRPSTCLAVLIGVRQWAEYARQPPPCHDVNAGCGAAATSATREWLTPNNETGDGTPARNASTAELGSSARELVRPRRAPNLGSG